MAKPKSNTELTTTRVSKVLLEVVRQRAINEGRLIYSVLNEALTKGLKDGR